MKTVLKTTILPILLTLLVLIQLTYAQGSDPATTRLAQAVKFENLTRKEGVSGSEVRNVIQDEQGRIWFGTRYNGVMGVDFYVITIILLSDPFC